MTGTFTYLLYVPLATVIVSRSLAASTAFCIVLYCPFGPTLKVALTAVAVNEKDAIFSHVNNYVTGYNKLQFVSIIQN